MVYNAYNRCKVHLFVSCKTVIIYLFRASMNELIKQKVPLILKLAFSLNRKNQYSISDWAIKSL